MLLAPVSRLLAFAAACLVAVQAQADPFVFVSLPDTQIYAENRPQDLTRQPAMTDPRGTGAIFFDQTQWIADNAEALDIRYVGHLGDIVQNGQVIEEWELAKDAMGILLDADIPHGTVMGNHDDVPDHPEGYQVNYLEYFGPQVFAGRPWYTASSPGGGANFQLLEHGPYKIGFLNFSIDHPRSEVEWATDLVQANPDTIFIVGTHRYLYDFKLGGGRYGEDAQTDLGLVINLPQGFVPGVTDGLDAEELFHEFIRVNENVLMVHAGHFHAEWLRLDGENTAGNQIIQILTDYQSTRNGGDGYLRIYEMDFDLGQLRFHTYSPTLDRRRTTIDHFVEMIFLVWDQRDQVKDLLGVPNDAIYLQLMSLILKEDPNIGSDFLDDHPDFDEPHERAYYEQYLSDLFGGTPLEGFDDITQWQKLWFFGFAADRNDLTDFSDGSRSPSGVVPVDFSAYFTPSPEQLLAFAYQALLDAVRGAAWTLPVHGSIVERIVEFAERWPADHPNRLAARLLRLLVLPRVDGCAERGEPDAVRGLRGLILQLLGRGPMIDWIDDCDAQAAVHGPLVEVLDLLE